MRALIQRVSRAKVLIDGEISGEIEKGLLVLLGITQEDQDKDIEWLIKKTVQLRIFNDREGKMNLSVDDIKGNLLVVSQFTLFADCKKGNRPSYIRSAHPDQAIPMYEKFLSQLRLRFSGEVETGEFGAMMEIDMVNDGPVTIMLDSKMPSF